MLVNSQFVVSASCTDKGQHKMNMVDVVRPTRIAEMHIARLSALTITANCMFTKMASK